MPRSPCDLLLDGLALIFTDGRPAATPVLRRAVAAFAGPEVSAEEMLRWGWLATRAANFLWDYDSCLEIGTRAVQLARDSGALEVLAVADNACGQAAAFGGDFATRRAARSRRSTPSRRRPGRRIAPHAAIALAGIRGREAEASELIDGVIASATAGGQGTAVQYAHWASAVLMNGLGRYEEALAAAVEASEDTPELFIAVVGAERADRGRHQDRERRARGGARSRGSREQTEASRRRLGARHPRPVARAAERGRGRRAAATARPSSAWGARGCGPTSRARTCSTGSGCAASTAASTRASSCARRTSCS